MALVDREVVDPQPSTRVYIAGRLREAKDVERVLTGEGIDYFVEIERFERLLLGFVRREYDGVAFHVTIEHADRARVALRQARLTAGLEDADR